jgi:hypothetical protein
MTNYAEGTSVPVDRSKAELDRLLAKHGASQQGTMSDNEKGEAYVVFRMGERNIRLNVPLPKIGDFSKNPNERVRRPRSAEQQHRSWEQACRERWRSVVLLVKAKLEAIRIGNSTVEREFLSDIVLPSGKSVYEQIEADVAKAYLTGHVPRLLGMSLLEEPSP